jgi:hypothetical protein
MEQRHGPFQIKWKTANAIGKKDFEKIYGPTNENGQWRIKINSELESKYKVIQKI